MAARPDLVHGEHAEIGRHWRIEVFNFRCVKPLDIRLLVVELFKNIVLMKKNGVTFGDLNTAVTSVAGTRELDQAGSS